MVASGRRFEVAADPSCGGTLIAFSATEYHDIIAAAVAGALCA